MTAGSHRSFFNLIFVCFRQKLWHFVSVIKLSFQVLPSYIIIKRGFFYLCSFATEEDLAQRVGPLHCMSAYFYFIVTTVPDMVHEMAGNSIRVALDWGWCSWLKFCLRLTGSRADSIFSNFVCIFFFICFRFTDRKYTGCFRIDPEIWLLSILHMIVVKQKQRRMESNSHVESWNVWKFESSPNIS